MSPDPARVEALLAETGWIRRLARSLLQDEDAADDLVQDVWLQALRRFPRPDWDLRRWARGVVRHLISHRLRAAGRRVRRERTAARDEALPATAELVEQASAQRHLADVVLRLREPYRTTVLLRYFRGLSSAEIARRQGVPVSTVRTRLSRAFERLRDRLDERCEGRREAWVGALMLLAGTRPTLALTTAAAAAAGVLVAGAAAWFALAGGKPSDVAGRAPASRPEAVERRDKGAPRKTVVAATREPVAKVRADRRSRGATGGLQASAKRRPPKSSSVVASPESAPAVFGTVRDAAGRPVAGAEVLAFDAVEIGFGPGVGVDGAVARAVTDVDGRYAIRVAPDWLLLFVTAPGLAAPRALHHGRGGRDFTLTRSGHLVGHVFRGEDRSVLPGATVAVFDTRSYYHLFTFDRRGNPRVLARRIAHQQVATDGEGRFSLTDLPPGDYRIEVMARDYPLLKLDGQPLSIPAGGTVRREIVLPAGGGEHGGRVVHATTGRPVPGAVVRDVKNHHQIARTDHEGKFRLRGVVPDRTVLHVAAEGFAARRTTVRSGVSGTQAADIAIRPAAGSPSSPSAKPRGVVTGRIVPPPWPPVQVSLLCPDADGSVPDPSITDPSGRFAFRDVAPGRYRFSVWLFRQYHRFSTVVTVAAGGDHRVELPLDESCTITGRIVDTQGRPVPLARIDVRTAGRQDARRSDIAFAGPRGRFRIRGPAPREVRLKVYSHGRHPRTEVRARAGERGLLIRLANRFPVCGQVVLGSSGTPAATFWVRVRPGGRTWRVQAPDGRFAIPGAELPPGAFSLEAGDDDGRRSRRMIGLDNARPVPELRLALEAKKTR